MRNGVKLRELELVVGADVDVRATVLGHVAVLGRRENWITCQHMAQNNEPHSTPLTSDALPVVLLLVAVHPNFVAADDRLQAVLFTEPLGDIRAELHAHTALAGPTAGLRLRVRPQHLHHQPSLPGLALLVPVEFPDIVQSHIVVREEAAVKDEELLADQGGQREGGKAFREQLEDAERTISIQA